ncbi:MAG TPA: hypothetical protein VKP30_33880 [Polyangiaceae bacterium]|nr:hypothetical protein [Polyangiaceae bacterium]
MPPQCALVRTRELALVFREIVHGAHRLGEDLRFRDHKTQGSALGAIDGLMKADPEHEALGRGNRSAERVWQPRPAQTLSIGVSLQVPQSERYMIAQFGEEYLAYAKHTGRFVPRLRRR